MADIPESMIIKTIQTTTEIYTLAERSVPVTQVKTKLTFIIFVLAIVFVGIFFIVCLI